MISLQNISLKYQQYVLKDFSYNFYEKEIVCIVGKNGAGKSTLLNLIAGVIKPSKGEIIMDNINIKDKKYYLEYRKKVSMVFQNPDMQSLFPMVYDDIEFTLKNLKMDDVKNRINKSLEMVNMLEYKKNNFYELSLGQKQRINIAGAIASNPKYLLLDEATTMIDSSEKIHIYNTLKRLNSQGITIIMVTNNMEEMLLADRILVLENGNIKYNFLKKDILNNIDILEKSHIEIPTIVKIIENLNRNKIKIEMKDWTLDELNEKLILYIKEGVKN